MALIRPDLSRRRPPQIGDDPRRDIVDAQDDREEVVLLKNELINKVLVECHEGENLDIFIFPNNGQTMNIVLSVDTLVRIIKRRNGIDPDAGNQMPVVQVGDGLADYDKNNVVIQITEDDLFPRQS